MSALVSAIMQSLQPKFDQLETRFQMGLARVLGQSEEPKMPSASSLPPCDGANPWRSTLRAPSQNGMITLKGIGTRPMSDFEFFLGRDQFPYMYV